MNAKTYGQVLRDAMDNEDDFERLSMVDPEAFERCARAVILEAFRRVEERAEELDYKEKSKPFYRTSEDYLSAAFFSISTELKEAK